MTEGVIMWENVALVVAGFSGGLLVGLVMLTDDLRGRCFNDEH